ncbi:MAG: GNAT family N-acetyltransferase [Nanoarchaeota archaeon]|nr:GNAT family N-acetyltransferase [Nanoarchaeota archaeon]
MAIFLLSLLEKCNLNCKHCRSEKKNRMLSVADIKKIISKVKAAHASVNLTGGEPLMQPQIEEIIRLFKKSGIKVSLSTNGTFLTDNKAQRLKSAGLDAINISLDSLDEKFHNSIRNSPTSFKEALNAISTAVGAGLNTRIASVYSKQNISNIVPMALLGMDKGCSAVSFRKILPVGKAEENMLVNKMEDILFLKKCYMALSLLYPYFNLFIEHPLDPYIASRIFNKKADYIGCGAFKHIFEIKTDGSVFACPALPLKIGNIFTDNLSKIAKNREGIINIEKLAGKCKECDLKNVCGGCRALAYYVFKEPNEEDVFCIRKEAEDIINEVPILEEKTLLLAEEINRIAALTEDNLRIHLEKSGIKWDRKILENDLKKKSCYWLIRKKGYIAGYVWFENGKETRLKAIVLDETLRKQGIGSLLLERLRYAAKGKPLIAFVQKSNKISQKFFEANNYKRIGEEKAGFIYRK